jgi:hypothetical protein
VVVPTDTEVKLTYSKTPLDWFFYSLTILGIVLCFYWRRRGDVVYAGERPDWRRSLPTAAHEDADSANTSAVDVTVPIDRPLTDAPPNATAAATAVAAARTATATAEADPWFDAPPASTDDDR